VNLHSLLTLLLMLLLALVCWFDWRYLIIPNSLNLAIAILGLLASSVVLHLDFQWVLLEATTGLGIFWMLATLYSTYRKQVGLGGGDIKFLGAATCWVGLVGLPWTLLVASISGLVFVLVKSLIGHQTGGSMRLAFGPHLALGVLVSWLMQQEFGLQLL
jgi:leader peptidase (prepilin peptidase) / N-methyltransferase